MRWHSVGEQKNSSKKNSFFKKKKNIFVERKPFLKMAIVSIPFIFYLNAQKVI